MDAVGRQSDEVDDEMCDEILVEALSSADLLPHHVRNEPVEAQVALPPPFPLCLPKGPQPPILVRPEASAGFMERFPAQAGVYERVRRSDNPNYRGERIQLDHQLNIATWRRYEHLLPDHSLVDMLAYGFPAGYTTMTPPTAHLSNHSSATREPAHVTKYVAIELRHQAILGPLAEPPFTPWARINPMKDTTELRVIMDLSFPEGSSVNWAIPREALDGEPFKLRLPMPDMLLYKIDLKRAYRQLRSDPLDWPLLGLLWQGEAFIDTAIPFGLRHGRRPARGPRRQLPPSRLGSSGLGAALRGRHAGGGPACECHAPLPLLPRADGPVGLTCRLVKV